MKFGQILTFYRERAQLSKIDLARLLRVSHTYIINIEHGRSKAPSHDRLDQLSEIFRLSGKDKDEFYRIAAQERLPTDAKDYIHKYVERTPSPPGQRRIPVFDAACGKFIDWTDGSHPAGHYPETDLSDTRDPHGFYVRASGDSMTGRADDRRSIYDGDLLLVEPSKQLHDGDISFCRHDDCGVMVKKIKIYDDEIHLIPLNEKFKTVILTKKETVRCFKITEIKRKL